MPKGETSRPLNKELRQLSHITKAKKKKDPSYRSVAELGSIRREWRNSFEKREAEEIQVTPGKWTSK